MASIGLFPTIHIGAGRLSDMLRLRLFSLLYDTIAPTCG